MTLHPSIQSLVDEIEAFCREAEMSASTFGWEALKDRNFVGDLGKGRLPSVVTIDRVRNFIRSRQEANAA
jgi:hypothetical protein